MSFVASYPESFLVSGYAPARGCRSGISPAYAEVSTASPGSSAITQPCADLDNVMLDCHQPGWDGYDAEGISFESYQLAKRFIHSLPAGIPSPRVSADPDGCVTFEWRLSPRRLLLVSVHPDYRIDYAALFGSEKSYGTVPFFDAFPAVLSSSVRRVYQT